MILFLFALAAAAATGDEPTWSKETIVRHGKAQVVSFQTRLDGDYLLVKAVHRDGWHTYAMDNALRAAKALQGKSSLGIEQGIEISVEGGLELEGTWRQTEPKDLSQPEIRWFTYGFDHTVFFARRARLIAPTPITVHIQGQACDGETCCQVDVELKLPAAIPSSAASSQGPSEPFKKIWEGLVTVQAAEPNSETPQTPQQPGPN